MTIYVDLDQTLADFDTHHDRVFGYRPIKETDTKPFNVNWDNVRVTQDFFRSMPPMPDMRILWRHIEKYKPIIITGVPSSVPEAASNKEAWVAEHLPGTKVICCRSSEKYLHCTPGSILIDDWDKWKDRWVNAGGLWITHYSALETIAALKFLGL